MTLGMTMLLQISVVARTWIQGIPNFSSSATICHDPYMFPDLFCKLQSLSAWSLHSLHSSQSNCFHLCLHLLKHHFSCYSLKWEFLDYWFGSSVFLLSDCVFFIVKRIVWIPCVEAYFLITSIRKCCWCLPVFCLCINSLHYSDHRHWGPPSYPLPPDHHVHVHFDLINS